VLSSGSIFFFHSLPLLSLSKAACTMIPAFETKKRKTTPRVRFAEAIRKSKEKRAGMQRATERPAKLEDESRNREDTSIADRAFETIKGSES